ncbi:MAG: DNA mismatch repair endonuclease MutL [Myxococcota bacterium]
MAIRLLDDALIDQIAAGEVVERPASVIKELVENSLDAGATTLRVTLKEGGKSLIRVVDNGEGMNRSDAVMCLERHATSKIRTLDELVRVRTLGFRGEAIPSIGSVSQMEILTRRHDEEVGTRITIEGGVLKGVADAGCAAGTQISVRSLFYNIPVRKEFLRTTSTELGHCVDAVLRQVLLRVDLDASVTHEGREVLRAPAALDLAVRVRQLLGKDADRLQSVDFESASIQVRGLVSPVGVHHASGRAVHIYVNQRHVRDPVLRRAIRKAYEGVVPRGRHPVVVLDISLPSQAVDVNVHPNKTEVRFRSPRQVVDVIARGIGEGIRRSALQSRPAPAPTRPDANLPLPLTAHPDDDPTWTPRPPAEPTLPAWLAGELRTDETPAAPQQAQARALSSPVQASIAQAHPAASTPRGVKRSEPPATAAQPLASLDGRIVLAKHGETLWLVDGHALRAAHANLSLNAGGDPQRLLVPRTVEVGRGMAERLVSWADSLDTVGLSLAAFAPGVVVLRRLPRCLLDADWDQTLRRLADALESEAEGPAPVPEPAIRVLSAADVRPYSDPAMALAAHAALGEVDATGIVRTLDVDELLKWMS